MKNFPKTLRAFYWSVIKMFPIYFTSLFILTIVLEVFSNVLNPLINKWVFSIFEGAIGADFSQVQQFLLFIVIASIAILVTNLIISVIRGRYAARVRVCLQQSLYRRVYENDTDYFINKPAGQIANKVGEVQRNFTPVTLDFWGDIVSFVLSFILISGMLFQINIWLSVLIVSNGILRMAWQLWRQRLINKVGKELLDVTSEISGVRTDSLGNVITAKLFANTNYENDYIQKKQQEDIRLSVHNAFLIRTRWLPTSVMWHIVRILLIVICWFLIRDGQMTLPDAAFALTSFLTINNMFLSLNGTINDFWENSAKAKHAYADIIRDMTVVDKSRARNLRIGRAAILFENVGFDYGAAAVIRDFNLDVGAGQKIGIVGLSGAGKTTLVNLIERMYDVKSGAIKIDGADIRDVTQNSLRRSISFVPQESVLFNRTLLENIKYARPFASKNDVIAAAKKAHIHEFIDGLPNKYDTLVGNRGIKLSGGQRQRIAIARAILKDAPILILDEATSALDSESELYIQKALQRVMRGKTTIAIAHRLSTLRNMDMIIVMDKGRIAERGTHTQLLRRGGIYKKLWGMQTGGFIKE